jgi:FxsC-like protein
MRVFVSYARNDLDGGELERFLDELERDLKGLTGDTVEILFRDLKDLRLGAEWKPALEDALKSSALMLAICSSSFFKSDYCGREYSVFLDRLARAPKSPTGSTYRPIFPVVWLPAGESGAPESVNRFQFGHADLPRQYATGGLRPLFRLARNRDDALEFVAVLAREMASALKNPLPAARELMPLDQVPNAFGPAQAAAAGGQAAAGKQTSYARVIVVAGRKRELEEVRTFVGGYDDDGRLWRPFLPESDRPIMVDAQLAIGEENLGSEVLVVGDRVLDQIKQAEKNNEVVLVLVDPWTMLLKSYADQIRPFDEFVGPHCALIAVWNKKDEETKDHTVRLEDALDDIFHKKMRFAQPGHIFNGVETRNDFVSQLKRATAEAKLRVIQLTSRHRRVEEPGLQAQAKQAGIDLAAPAILQNSSGEQS